MSKTREVRPFGARDKFVTCSEILQMIFHLFLPVLM